jgi:hypothetical protein
MCGGRDIDRKRTTRESNAAEEHVQHGVPHMPRVPVPRMPTGKAGRVLWWGGLAAVAAAGVVDWPVAALVAAGSWVAEQYAKAGQRPDRDRQADR